MTSMPIKTQPFHTILKRIVTHTSTIKSFYLYFQDGRMPFNAGQFVMAAAPREGKIVKKPYSIASAPFEDEYVELCIKRVEGGFMSNYFHNLREGDHVQIEGPLGKFVMEHTHRSGELIFAATSTGIAPLRSMMNVLFREGARQPIHCILGIRYEREILYEQEFLAWEARYNNFQFIPTVSRPTEGWKGERGYVQEQLIQRFPDPAGTHLYACGLVNMIQGLKKTALEHGFAKEQLHYEVWT